MANDNDNLVVAYYINAAAAHAAADDLKRWDDKNKEVKLGAMAVMTINDRGELHADEIGQRNTGSGALWGTAIGVAAGILTAGIGLIPGLILGAGAGAGIGALSHKDVGMSDEQHEEMVAYLKDGGAALAVMADDFEIEDTLAQMVAAGGRTESYRVPQTTQGVMAATAAAQSSASAALDDAVSAAADEVEEAARSVSIDLPDLGEAAATAVGTVAAATGLSSAQAAKLNESGYEKVSDLLQSGATPAGRAEIAANTDMSEEEVLVAVKKLDLRRVTGVGSKYAALLLATGVDTVPELARRNAANLAKAMEETNATAKIAESLPSVADVEGWIAQAKELPRVIMY
jgi:uncharacterized membrane protein/predicted flap endonuclease-1-like 5' DNA nuclease